MSFMRVDVVGDATGEPPEIYWNLTVEIPVSPRMHPDAISRLRIQAWDALDTALNAALRAYTLPGPFGVSLYSATGIGRDAPTFPLASGSVRFAGHQDIIEVIEVSCQGTALTQLAYDHEGRAYELAAEVEYIRRPEADRAPGRRQSGTHAREP